MRSLPHPPGTVGLMKYLAMMLLLHLQNTRPSGAKHGCNHVLTESEHESAEKELELGAT